VGTVVFAAAGMSLRRCAVCSLLVSVRRAVGGLGGAERPRAPSSGAARAPSSASDDDGGTSDGGGRSRSAPSLVLAGFCSLPSPGSLARSGSSDCSPSAIPRRPSVMTIVASCQGPASHQAQSPTTDGSGRVAMSESPAQTHASNVYIDSLRQCFALSLTRRTRERTVSERRFVLVETNAMGGHDCGAAGGVLPQA
jgi:hypothetical protein